MEILYKVHHGLYVNLTDKCPCACTNFLPASDDGSCRRIPQSVAGA